MNSTIVRQKTPPPRSNKPDYYRHPDKLQLLRWATFGKIWKLLEEIGVLERKLAVLDVAEKDFID